MTGKKRNKHRKQGPEKNQFPRLKQRIRSQSTNISHKNMPLVPIMIGLFLTSISLFTYQVTLTRVFSPILRYHFVFLVTSMAIFGLGIGAIIAYRIGRKCSLAQVISQLPAWLIILSSSFLLSFSLIYKLPFIKLTFLYSIIASVPYIAGGIFIALIFMQVAGDSHKLYFADLLGAAVGSAAVVYMLDKIGVANTVLITTGLTVLSAVIIGYFVLEKKQLLMPIGVAIAPGFIAIAQPAVRQFERQFTGYFTSPLTTLAAMRAMNADHVLEDWSWDAFSRTDVVETGLSQTSKIVTIDGGANSEMLRFDGDLAKIKGLKADLNFVPFAFGKTGKTLLIGTGGGKDIVLALLGGSRDIDAVEINRGSIEMARRYALYNGNIYDRKEVNLFVQDGRNFVKKTSSQYDVIYLAQVMTQAAETIGYSLAENFIFTKEAVKDYWLALNESGKLSFILHDKHDLTRMLLTVVEALTDTGMPRSLISKQIVIVSSRAHGDSADGIHMPLLMVKKGPYTPSEITDLQALIAAGRHRPVYIPNAVEDKFFKQLIDDPDSSTAESAYASGKENFSPTSDNKPYFFDYSNGVDYRLLLLLAGVLLAGLLVFRPMFKRNQLKRCPYYFIGLAVGFMLIEIPLIQKFTLFLGHPTRAYIATVISLLSGAGIGSLLSSRKYLQWKGRYLPLLFVPILTAGVYALLHGFMNEWAVSSLAARFAITFGLLFPLGFFMGMPFPLGVQTLKKEKKERAIPLAWGINGTLSIAGSVLAIIISMKLGFSYALGAGALVYLLLFFLMPLYEKGWKMGL